MTKSTITDERITSVIERLEHFASNLKWTDVRGAQDLLTAADGLRELQERHQADSEPVILYRERNPYNGLTTGWQELTENEFSFLKENAGENAEFVTLYRHAQPAPVVSDDVRQALCKMDDEIIAELDAEESARRAAMLQAQSEHDDDEPTDDERIMAIEGIHNCERCGDEGWIVGEMGITRCACGQAGNSPAQSYCCPAQNSVAPAQSPIDHGYRPGCECSGCKTIVRICAELAGWIPVSEQLPEEGGRYWCYVEEQNSLGKSHYQWNCSWNGEIWGGAMMYGRVTHWMPLPNPPKEEK